MIIYIYVERSQIVFIQYQDSPIPVLLVAELLVPINTRSVAVWNDRVNDVLDVDAFFLARFFGNFDLLQVARDLELIQVVAATGRETRFNQLDIARPGRQTSENEEKGVPSLGHLRS